MKQFVLQPAKLPGTTSIEAARERRKAARRLILDATLKPIEEAKDKIAGQDNSASVQPSGGNQADKRDSQPADVSDIFTGLPDPEISFSLFGKKLLGSFGSPLAQIGGMFGLPGMLLGTTINAFAEAGAEARMETFRNTQDVSFNFDDFSFDELAAPSRDGRDIEDFSFQEDQTIGLDDVNFDEIASSDGGNNADRDIGSFRNEQDQSIGFDEGFNDAFGGLDGGFGADSGGDEGEADER